MKFTVEPLVHELSGFMMAIYVEELIVDEKRDDIVHVAFVYHFIDSPNPQIYFSLVGLVCCFVGCPSVEKLVKPSLEDSWHWWTIHLLF